MTTLIRIRELYRVFASPVDPPFNASIARLAVLYEDLRIEVMAVTEPSIAPLDATDERFRRNYFLRRSIATLVEFAEALRLVDQCNEFMAVKAGFNSEMDSYWTKALKAFAKREALLKNVRNDIGGHFGQEAGEYAVANLNPATVGKIEAEYLGKVYLHFAGEIAVVATLRHLRGSTEEVKFTNLLRTVVVCFRHAARCVHCIIFAYLWPKFG